MRVLQFVVLAWFAATGMALADAQEQGIIVTGEGRIAVAPDMATISLGVRERAETAQDAMAQVSESVAAIIARLDTLGIQPRDRQTSGFYLNPVYDNPGPDQTTAPRVAAYEAGNSVTVKVRDLTALGGMLDAVISEGANDFNGLSFGLRDDTDLLVEARKLAVADAMLRATQLADAAGLKLGTIVRINESSQSVNPMMMQMSKSSASFDSVPVEGGELDVRAQVTIVFAIAPGL